MYSLLYDPKNNKKIYFKLNSLKIPKMLDENKLFRKIINIYIMNKVLKTNKFIYKKTYTIPPNECTDVLIYILNNSCINCRANLEFSKRYTLRDFILEPIINERNLLNILDKLLE